MPHTAHVNGVLRPVKYKGHGDEESGRGKPMLNCPQEGSPCASDFERGSLPVANYARPGKLFTASGDLVESVVGALQPESLREVIAAVVTILGGSD
jgi:starvation-inducible outer membrane lipoprotein